MSWSIPLGRLAGTELRLHLTFFLLLLWIGGTGFLQGGTAAALNGIVFVLLVFACVVAHEYGHAFAARRYGIRTPDIMILPIGGLARLERMPETPGRELVVAIAGPLVNVAIAVVLYVFGAGRGAMEGVARLEDVQLSLMDQLLAVNIVLAVFNMVPAFPLDGGRIFRALLHYRLSRERATFWAARVGQVMAVGLGILGFLGGNMLLLLVAVFIFLAAGAESRREAEIASAHGRTARDAMVSRFEALRTWATARDAARLLLQTTQQVFPVLDAEGRLEGMVTRQGLVDAMAATGESTPVRSFMARNLPGIAAETPLPEVMQILAESEAPVAAVMAPNGGVLGFVTPENLAEFFLLQEAESRRQAR